MLFPLHFINSACNNHLPDQNIFYLVSIPKMSKRKNYTSEEAAEIIQNWEDSGSDISSGESVNSSSDSGGSDSNDDVCSSTNSSDTETKRELQSGRGIMANPVKRSKSHISNLQPTSVLSGWKPLTCATPGRTNSANVFLLNPGPVPGVRSRISSSPYNAWKFLIDETMLRTIQKCSDQHAKENGGKIDISLDVLETFIAVQYARGIYGRHHSVDFLWNKTYGPKLFAETMSRDTYKYIAKYLRFDCKNNRGDRLMTDKFTHIREIFTMFRHNCYTTYNPGFSLTIDEQLLPTKNRCPFIVFMPNKPDKFGIKFWVLAEVNTKYVVNIIPYLGKHEAHERQGRPLAQDVVLKLTDVVKNKGYQVTTDNFFTSVETAKLLLERKTTMVGTLRANSKGIPSDLKKSLGTKYDSKFFIDKESKIVFVNYQCKEKKNVCLLSSMHNAPTVNSTEKKKPSIIEFYNKNKVAVDNVDQMLRMYSTHSTTRRWPVAVWDNILDIAALNAWVLYKLCTGKNISRKQFILDLIDELRQHNTDKGESSATILEAKNFSPSTRRKCHTRRCSNASTSICERCTKPVCGTCAESDFKVLLRRCKDCKQ